MFLWLLISHLKYIHHKATCATASEIFNVPPKMRAADDGGEVNCSEYLKEKAPGITRASVVNHQYIFFKLHTTFPAWD